MWQNVKQADGQEIQPSATPYQGNKDGNRFR
jgi:hypothetical protein